MKKISDLLLSSITIFGLLFFLSLPAQAQVRSCAVGATACPVGCTLGVNCSSCWTAPTCTITTGQTYSTCGGCACPVGQVVCSVAGGGSACRGPATPLDRICPTGQTYNECTGCTGARVVELSPASSQGGYLTVTGSSDPGSATIGSIYYKTGTDAGLKVKTSSTGAWQSVGGSTYTGVGNISVSGSAINTVSNPTFAHITSGGSLSLTGSLRTGTSGDIYMNSGKAIRVDGSGITVLNIGNFDSAAVNFAANLIGNLLVSDKILLGQGYGFPTGSPAGSILTAGNVYTNAIYSRGATSSEDSIWVGDNNDILQVNGRVRVRAAGSGSTAAEGALTVSGTAAINGMAIIDGATLTSLSEFLKIQNLDNDSTSPATQYAFRVTDEDSNEWFSIKRNGYSSGGTALPPVTVATPGVLSAGQLISAGRFDVSQLVVLPSPVYPPTTFPPTGIEFYVSGDGEFTGNLTARGNLNLPSSSTLTVGGHLSGSSASFSSGLAVGTTTDRLSLDNDDIQTVTPTPTTLNLQRNGGAVKAYGNLEVDGIITAGGQDLPLTSAGGGLRLKELADEDFDSESEGYLPLLALQDTTCSTVCSSHGLVCDGSVRMDTIDSSNELTTVACGNDTSARFCFCKGS